MHAVTPVQGYDAVFSGTIDVKFDGGYVVTVTVGSEELKGVLFHVPDNMSRRSNTEGNPSSQNHGEGTSGSQSRKRAKYTPRDPFRPKSNRSGYNFFFAENYAMLKPSYHGQERAISKRIGFLWNNLSEAERQVQKHSLLQWPWFHALVLFLLLIVINFTYQSVTYIMKMEWKKWKSYIYLD